MRIGVFCSGGDAPGMNACVRAVVRSSLSAGHEVIGIRHGYHGLLHEDFHVNSSGEPRMTARCVSNIIKSGGTILRTSRSDEFRTEEGQRKAAEILRRQGIEALVAIGGDGTFRGALALSRYWDGPVIGCPGTIDNDVSGTDSTIGFATAVATAVEAVDKIRDTAESHERMFLIEVMGRSSGYIALFTALAAGAEEAILPETSTNTDQLVARIRDLKARGKKSIMLVVAEGDEAGGAMILDKQLREKECPFPTRVVILGHLQRGGSPVPDDRILATLLGDFAVRSLLAGKTKLMAGMIAGQLVLTPFEEVTSGNRPLPEGYTDLMGRMAI